MLFYIKLQKYTKYIMIIACDEIEICKRKKPINQNDHRLLIKRLLCYQPKVKLLTY